MGMFSWRNTSELQAEVWALPFAQLCAGSCGLQGLLMTGPWLEIVTCYNRSHLIRNKWNTINQDQSFCYFYYTSARKHRNKIRGHHRSDGNFVLTVGVFSSITVQFFRCHVTTPTGVPCHWYSPYHHNSTLNHKVTLHQINRHRAGRQTESIVRQQIFVFPSTVLECCYPQVNL